MTVTEIKNMAEKRTEGRGKKVLDLDNELLTVSQEFCSAAPYEWRRKVFTFNTVSGTREYDLTAVNPLPGLTDFEQLVEHGVSYIKSASEIVKLSKIIDPQEQTRALESTTAGEPDGYFISPSSPNVLVIRKVPDGAYKIRCHYWAMPLSNPQAWNGTVPVIPSYLHRHLVKGLEKQILRYTVGQADEAYKSALDEYLAGVAQAAAPYAK